MQPTDFLRDVHQFFERLEARMEDHVRKGGKELGEMVAENMGGRSSGQGFNTSTQLGSVSGRLRQAWKGGEGSVFRLQALPYPIAEVGVDTDAIPYAGIHEYGGIITATPRMIGKLFRLFAETREERYRITALSARKKGFISIPERPSIAPATEQFDRELPSRIRDIESDTEQLWG